MQQDKKIQVLGKRSKEKKIGAQTQRLQVGMNNTKSLTKKQTKKISSLETERDLSNSPFKYFHYLSRRNKDTRETKKHVLYVKLVLVMRSIN